MLTVRAVAADVVDVAPAVGCAPLAVGRVLDGLIVDPDVLDGLDLAGDGLAHEDDACRLGSVEVPVLAQGAGQERVAVAVDSSTVPMTPPTVCTSSPTSMPEFCWARAACALRCWGRMKKK